MTEKTTAPTTESNESIITLTMENGVEKDFELLRVLEHNCKQYAAISEPGSEEYDVIEIVDTEDGELQFLVIVDDNEYDAITNKFEELFAEQYTS